MTRLVLCLVGLLLASVVAPTVAAHQLSPDELHTVAFRQRAGESIPLNLHFDDENGARVTLGQFFGQRPVILSLNYFTCQSLCPLELQGLVGGLNGVPFTLGDQYTLISVSIDPRDTPASAATAKFTALRGYVHPEASAGLHLLTTADQGTIDSLASAVGFQYAYDDQEREYAHPIGVVVLTPGGQISRYIYGLDFSATDLRLSLVEAAAQRIGGLVEQVLLVCYHYDAINGRYTPLVFDVMKVAGAATVLLVGSALFWLRRSERFG